MKKILFIAFATLTLSYAIAAQAAPSNNGATCSRGSDCRSGYCLEGYNGLICSGPNNEGSNCSITDPAEGCRPGLYCQGDSFTCVADDRPVGGGAGTGDDGGSLTTPPPTLQTRTNCGPTEFCNPLAFNDVESFLSHFLTVLQRIIVVLSLIFIVIGALMYITSGGNDGQITSAKKAITAALIGLAIGLAAPSFLKEISTILGWGTTNNAAVNSALTLSQIALRVLNFLMSILGILALLMMVVGAMFYLTAAGDEKQVEKGKKIFQYSVLGVIIAMASMVVIRQISAFFIR